MVAEIEKRSQIWKKIGADLEKQFIQMLYIYGPRSGKMVRDVEKWSQIWLNGCKIGKFFADLEKFLQI